MNCERSLQDIIFAMLNDSKHMFYGLFLAELNKAFETRLPNACVGKHPGSNIIQLYINPNFWEKTLWNDSRKRFILIHELEHVIREHLSDWADKVYTDKQMANVAMDVSINQCIDEEAPRFDENGEKIGVFIEDFPELNLKPMESSLYYYQKFMEAKQRKQDSKSKCDSLCGPKGNGNGSSGSKNMDQLLENMESGKTPDWHKEWDELTKNMTKAEAELLRKEIQELSVKIAEETEKSRGTVPANLAEAIKSKFNYKEPVISWKTLFNRFIGASLSTDVRHSRKRPNFRFEDAPIWKYKTKVRIVVGVDTSGSVSHEELEEFFGQIRHMWTAGAKVDVCLWDASCEDPYEYKGEHSFKRTKCGGTEASCFIRYVNEHNSKHHWTCAIILTDGYIESKPIACKLPALWVITRQGNTEFEHKSKKIKMN